MRKHKRFLAALTALAVSLSVLCVTIWEQPAGAVTQAQIDAMKETVSNTEGQIEALQEQLSTIRNDKAQALAQKQNLDSQIVLLNQQIAQQDMLLAEYDKQIGERQLEIEELQAKEAFQYQCFCQRIRSMEEQGSQSYLSILFSSSSFSDLLDRAMLVGEIMEYDNGLIEALQATRRELEAAKAVLEQEQAAQQAVRDEQASALAQLQLRQAEADELVRQIISQESEYQAALTALEEEEERIQAEILRLSEELAAQQAANSAALGGYIWPVSSRKITSPFGSRNTGIAGASTNHKGVDIGGVGYTTEVHAAKTGTVIISQLSSSYGNYVVISHGNGNTTLYAHMSSRSVSAGDVVDQGDVLGITGSTGISRGAHLHFEITENGERVDPLEYLTGYVKGW